jgi:hypothetical protein
MRINKRFLQKAPKRGPDELKIELEKLKLQRVMKAMGFINSSAINLGLALAKPFEALKEALCSFNETITNYFDEYPEVREKLEVIQKDQKQTGLRNQFQEMPIFNIDSLLHTLETS